MDSDIARYCADQVRRFDHDRYLCALFAPMEARAHIIALYAFNLEIAKIREVVSEPILGQVRLQWWREAVTGAVSGELRHHPVALALAEAIRTRNLPPERFEQLLTAREQDLSEEPPADLGALERYAEGTGASLIELALDALAVSDASTHIAARHVGIGWALTGLLRAVPFHAAQRRVYLPQDVLARAGIDIDQLFEGRHGTGLTDAAHEIAGRARHHLAAARERRKDVPKRAISALMPAVLADMYLKRLERARFSLFDPSIRRPVGERALMLAWAALRGRY